ncbi:MAG: ABC transporter permease [Drouetiella hepatica Uher 2000/2452]|jgi:simple sugar transport system permease protein|uniref:ABC transporter permease n=1 Tax=Drouetiella hepatica Uher 2000/2452 TaxID=904376 RepID=A0A951QGE8_9CYAN|nr:ABC transporter permease [Drouetiella hepatica Uher 2000/2452]
MKTNQVSNAFLPFLAPMLAIVAALIVGAFLIALTGVNPLHAYTILFRESLANYYGIGNTLTKMAPLLLTASGVLVGLRAGQLNIGGEGQIHMGGLGAALVGLYVHGLPMWIHIPLALIGGFLLGAIWGGIAGYLKAFRGVNEVITTLLLNYIALNIISYLVQRPMIEPGAASPFTPIISDSAKLPILMPGGLAHAGIFIGLIATMVLGWLFRRSPLGYQIEVVGQNPTAARYAGMSVSRTIMFVMALAGGLAGLAGAGEVMGLKHRLFETISPGYGYEAVAIALLSRGSFTGVIFTSLFFGALRSGANVLQREAGIPFTIVYAIQGLTVLFIAISLAVESNLLHRVSLRMNRLKPAGVKL